MIFLSEYLDTQGNMKIS